MPKNRVLIADDIATIELFEAYLAEGDYEIATATDDAEILAAVESFVPNLILLDIVMPKLCGFEVCEKLKSNPKTQDIMIIMVAAHAELSIIERAVTAGCDNFLSKPINKEELLKNIETMLKLQSVLSFFL